MRLGRLWFSRRWMRVRLARHYSITLNVLTPRGVVQFTISTRSDRIASPEPDMGSAR